MKPYYEIIMNYPCEKDPRDPWGVLGAPSNLQGPTPHAPGPPRDAPGLPGHPWDTPQTTKTNISPQIYSVTSS